MKKLLPQKTEHVLLLTSTTLALLFFLWGINSWKFAFIGDEWQFYAFAKSIVEQDFMLNPFNLIGVHGQNSVMGSMYQALFLKIFGFSNAAWRLSNVVLIVPTSILFFLFVKREFGKNIALVSTIMLQFSAYLANYFKIGYINPQSFFLLILSLYLASRTGRDPNMKNFILLGIVLGISFYIYLGPLIPFLIWPFLLPALKLTKKKLYTNFTLAGISYALLLLPVLFNISQIGGPTEKFITSKEFDNNFQIIINIFQNFLLFYKNFDYFYNHFVEGAYLDIISQIFAFIGTMLCLAYIFRKSSHGLLLISYISACVILGLSSPYPYTPTTRGIFFLPYGFIFAGIGLIWIKTKLKLPRLSYIILPAIIALNIFQSQIGVFHKTGHGATTLIIKILQESKASGDNKKTLLLLQDGHSYSGHLLPLLQGAYGLENLRFEKTYTSQISCSALRDADTVVIFSKDWGAKHAINSFQCFNNKTNIVELDPNIYF